jgi:hypothetical protein
MSIAIRRSGDRTTATSPRRRTLNAHTRLHRARRRILGRTATWCRTSSISYLLASLRRLAMFFGHRLRGLGRRRDQRCGREEGMGRRRRCVSRGECRRRGEVEGDEGGKCEMDWERRGRWIETSRTDTQATFSQLREAARITADNVQAARSAKRCCAVNISRSRVSFDLPATTTCLMRIRKPGSGHLPRWYHITG